MHLPHELQERIDLIESRRADFVGLTRDEAQVLARELQIQVRFLDGRPLSADFRPTRLDLRIDDNHVVTSAKRG